MILTSPFRPFNIIENFRQRVIVDSRWKLTYFSLVHFLSSPFLFHFLLSLFLCLSLRYSSPFLTLSLFFSIRFISSFDKHVFSFRRKEEKNVFKQRKSLLTHFGVPIDRHAAVFHFSEICSAPRYSLKQHRNARSMRSKIERASRRAAIVARFSHLTLRAVAILQFRFSRRHVHFARSRSVFRSSIFLAGEASFSRNFISINETEKSEVKIVKKCSRNDHSNESINRHKLHSTLSTWKLENLFSDS